MLIRNNVKGVSTLAIILLMTISAITGGLLSYIFTIAFFIDIPEETTVTITDIYFDNANARSFKISVLNPSYSLTNATITRIALSLKEGIELYNIVETVPPIENGIVIPRSECINITCFKAQKGGDNVTWGRLAGEFAGENVIVHVFSPHSPAANRETSLPFVKLHINDTDFDSEVSFNKFNITIMNDVNSEVNLTINEIAVAAVDLTKNDISPRLPQPIANGTQIHFNCSGRWHNLVETTLTAYTEEGYVFSEKLELPRVYTRIQNILLNENHTNYFNVTVVSFAGSTSYVNVTKITCTLENGTVISQNYRSVGIEPNSTYNFRFDWNWTEYRRKKINVTAYLLQDFKTDIFMITTPPPVIFNTLYKKKVFDLKDPEHFNITLRNHPSSIEAVNITKITVKEDSEVINVINGTMADPKLPYGPIDPNQEISFYCNITNWTGYAGGNLTLTVYAINETLGNYKFEFTFTLPMAELNITRITPVIGETKYLNITIKNLNYSVWNLTTSKVIITLPNQSEPLEQVFPKNQIILKPGEIAALLFAFDWEDLDEIITITVITEEGVETSWKGKIST